MTKEAPLVSTQNHDNFFNAIRQHCGKAFEGKVSVDNPSGTGFGDQKLIMHIRRCTDSQIQIPFHIGNNASRTWIITKTGSGLSLKHDHRKEDGTDDPVTMYGGHTLDDGWSQVQSFPADQYSKNMFVAQGLPQSIDNTWQIFIYPNQFTYRLVRQGREFRVDFDLDKEAPKPPTPWGYAE